MNRKKYKYILIENYEVDYDFSYLFKNSEAKEFSNEFGKITENKLVIYKNYAWDGCSGHVWQGKTIIPEEWMPKISEDSDRYTDTLASSLVHDYIYQFLFDIKKVTGSKYEFIRKIADKLFYYSLIKSKFIYARYYYYGVRLFGIIVYRNIR